MLPFFMNYFFKKNDCRYAEMLAAECADYWRGGRQLCEQRSLTGRRCANRRHRVPGGPDPPAPLQADGRRESADGGGAGGGSKK